MNSECQEIQEKILMQLTEADKSLKWLAKKISMPYTQLHYQLHYATKLSTDTYSAIQKALDTELDKKVSCDTLTGVTFSVGSSLNDEISRLFNAVGKSTEDGKISQTEKMLLILQIKDMQNNINTKLNQMLKLLGE